MTYTLPPPPQEQVQTSHFDDPAVDLRSTVAAVLVLEAGGEGSKGMQAVMNVIANRARGRSFLDVVLQPKQFSCLNQAADEPGLRRLVNMARRSPSWGTAQKLVDLALAGKLADITRGSKHYYATRLDLEGKTPRWAEGKPGLVIGRQKFLA